MAVLLISHSQYAQILLERSDFDIDVMRSLIDDADDSVISFDLEPLHRNKLIGFMMWNGTEKDACRCEDPDCDCCTVEGGVSTDKYSSSCCVNAHSTLPAVELTVPEYRAMYEFCTDSEVVVNEASEVATLHIGAENFDTVKNIINDVIDSCFEREEEEQSITLH